MRGTSNESAVLNFTRHIPAIEAVFEVGMLGSCTDPHLACSPDGVALVKADSSVSVFLHGAGDIQCEGNALWIAPVEIKTKVSASTVQESLGLMNSASIHCFICDETCREHIPKDHMLQMLHQATVMKCSLAIYVASAETGVLYTVFMRVNVEIRNVALSALNLVSASVVKWAHETENRIPSFVPSNQRSALQSRLDFWSAVNNHVISTGPFQPLKLFKHATQSFYSKTKGGVDGATQYRAVLTSSGSQLAWEQKLITQVLKSLSINAFLAWRIFERRDLVNTSATFKSLDNYRCALNRVQSTSDFMVDASLELLSHAKSIHCNTLAGPSDHDITVADGNKLMQKARGTKRRRLEFFNSEDGISLRLKAEGHIPVHGLKRYCVLCGQNKQSKGTNGKVWRGHRTTICCQVCSVNVCARIYRGLRKSCWSIWHSTKKLVVRDTPCPDRNDEDESDGGDDPEDGSGT